MVHVRELINGVRRGSRTRWRSVLYDMLYDRCTWSRSEREGRWVRASIDFPSLVRDLRQARGLTQEQLAREVGVTFSTVNGWENGRHQPIPALASRLVAMAEKAGVRRPLLSSPKERARVGRKHTRGAGT